MLSIFSIHISHAKIQTLLRLDVKNCIFFPNFVLLFLKKEIFFMIYAQLPCFLFLFLDKKCTFALTFTLFMVRNRTYNRHIVLFMKRILSLLALMLALLPAQAQVEEIGGFDFTKKKAEQEAEAKRAQEAAQEAAQKAEEERKAAAAEQERLKAEEEQRQANTKGKKAKVKTPKVKTKEELLKDSLRMVAKQQKLLASQEKLRTWNTKWGLGGQLAVNWLVADNVTDHPPFKHLGDALNVGMNVYATRFLTKVTGVRAGVGFHRMSNRVDRETVDEAWHNNWSSDPANPCIIYDGNGYYNFNVFEAYFDGMFDVTGLKRVERFRPFHVYATVGLGMLAAGEKKLKGTMHEELFEYFDDPDDGRQRIRTITGGICESFESRVSTKSSAALALRFGLLLDYRFARNLSANLELNANITTNDRLEGIKYAEPFDIPLRIAGGVMFRF